LFDIADDVAVYLKTKIRLSVLTENILVRVDNSNVLVGADNSKVFVGADNSRILVGADNFKEGGGGGIYNLCGIRPKHSNISKGGGLQFVWY
jgi:hypothetical protein